jgi:hypothetical protein
MKSRRRISKTAAVGAFVVLGTVAFSRGAAAQQAEPQHPGDPNAPSAQQQSATPQPAAAAAALTTTTAKVEKIDKANGTIMLKSAGGRSLDVKAGPAVNMDRLKVGDTVAAAYFDEVAVSIDKTSGPPRMTTKAVERAGVTAMQSTVTSRIISVDAAKNTVTIRGPKGAEHTLKVEDPGLQSHLKDIKPGSNFDVTYTQAVAVSLEPKPAAPKPAPKAEPKK